MSDFLPVSKEDMQRRGWNECDFVYVTGDAYVDHPSFGIAIITRLLESQGFKVGVIAQPDWHSADAFKILGRPRLGFLVSSGNIDSMVAHYTAAKKQRSEDLYSPGGKPFKRPDRAVIAYTNRIREAFGDIPVIIGGLEASLRRFAHYDYWDDKVRRSILFDSGADILSYGMGENSITEIAARLRDGEPVKNITDIRGTCVITGLDYERGGAIECDAFETVKENKTAYAKACRIQYDQQDAVSGKTVVQRHGDKYLVQNPPAKPLSQEALDKVYALPYMRYYHPMYEQDGGVPAIEEVEFSITHNRGCFGACNFCSIAFHQGRVIQTRSKESVLSEAKKLIGNPHFKGYIHDVGGPTANFRKPSCERQKKYGLCPGRKCLAPQPCRNLEVSHREYLDLLRSLRTLPKVKKVFVRSGLRFDYIMADKDDTFFKELVKNHVSGQLKVAPEHCSAEVLDKMGKPHIEAYKAFMKKFYDFTKKAGKEQYLVPYLMSSHPGSTLKDAVELALFLKKEHIRPEQVQDFYPTPGTISTAMFYTGLDPFTLKPVYVPKTAEEKAMQRALLQYFNPKNRSLVIAALEKAGRRDLIGFSQDCLIAPARNRNQNHLYNNKEQNNTINNHKNSDSQNNNSKYRDTKDKNYHNKNSKYRDSKDSSYQNDNSKYRDSKGSSYQNDNSKYRDSKDSSYQNNNSKYRDSKDSSYQNNNSKYGDSKDSSYQNNNSKYRGSKDSSYQNSNSKYRGSKDSSYQKNNSKYRGSKDSNNQNNNAKDYNNKENNYKNSSYKNKNGVRHKANDNRGSGATKTWQKGKRK